jgi:hypothetical protein
MLKIKRLLVLSIVIMLISCASQQQPPERQEIPDQVWNDLSRDLAEFQALVTSYNEILEREQARLKVKAEPWTYPKQPFINVATPLEKKIPVEKIAIAKILSKSGAIKAVIIKYKKAKLEKNEEDYLILPPEIAQLALLQVPVKIEKYTTKKYGVRDKFISVTVSDQLVGLIAGKRRELIQFLKYDKLIDEAYEIVTKQIKALQEKYNNAPFYIEGFNVTIGLPFSVEIIFKIKY